MYDSLTAVAHWHQHQQTAALLQMADSKPYITTHNRNPSYRSCKAFHITSIVLSMIHLGETVKLVATINGQAT